MALLEKMQSERQWRLFLLYKQQNNHISKKEAQLIENFIQSRRYEHYCGLIERGDFPSTIPEKRTVNKEGTQKKRIVYSFAEEENIVLKFIAYGLYEYDDLFSPGCYAFRRGYGAKDAMRRFREDISYGGLYCFKADISNYFNSIDVELLIEKLGFVQERDLRLFQVFVRLLRESRVYEDGVIIEERHGAMAGTPVSPFFANVYLSDVDRWFYDRNIRYFRYSDDILIFADTREKLDEYIDAFNDMVESHGLSVNMSKSAIAEPGESWEFLGFSYSAADGRAEIDISAHTMKKIKGKIKRKADALRRWQRRKGLAADKAAKGFIKAMNIKFFGYDSTYSHGDDGEKVADGIDTGTDSSDFTWCRWFFPNITTDRSLKRIDGYMQEYIRYVMTGRHYKGNYRITYEQLKALGYRSLVHEYYGGRKELS